LNLPKYADPTRVFALVVRRRSLCPAGGPWFSSLMSSFAAG
jgi:hypothetical protein